MKICVKKTKNTGISKYTNKYYLLGMRVLQKDYFSNICIKTKILGITTNRRHIEAQNNTVELSDMPSLVNLLPYINLKHQDFKNSNVESATIVIPVYNGVEHLHKLVPSLIKNTPASVQIIIIDDCSPDTETTDFLNTLKSDARFKIHRNTRNLGFVGSTNAAMRMVNTRYAVWLNSDTVVGPYWLERLLAPFNDFDKVATATPFTNSGVTFSFPDFAKNNELAADFETMDRAFQKINPINVPLNSTYSGTGFCMAIDMRCWHQVGELDQDTFGKGYGEENDWCFRAGRAGWRHVLVPNLLIWHRNGGSFLSEEKQRLSEEHSQILKQRYQHEMNTVVPDFFNRDPWKVYRQVAALMCCADNPVVVIDLRQEYSDKSGAIDYRKKMIDDLKAAGHNVILLQYIRYEADVWSIVPASIDPKTEIKLNTLAEVDLLFQIMDIKKVIINNLAFLRNVEDAIDIIYEIKKKHNPWMAYKCHDYLCCCPSLFLLNKDGKNCPNFDSCATCDACIACNRFRTIDRHDIMKWRGAFSKLFSCVDEFNFFSEYTYNKIRRVYPIVQDRHTIKEHESLMAPDHTKYVAPQSASPLTIAFVGNFCFEKGGDYFVELAEECNRRQINARFVVIGIDNPKYSHRDVTYVGGYCRDELGRVLTENNVHAVVYSSICNETFSYLAQELMVLNVPFIAFNNGAHAERIRKYKYDLAEIAPDITTQGLFAALQKLLKRQYSLDI